VAGINTRRGVLAPREFRSLIRHEANTILTHQFTVSECDSRHPKSNFKPEINQGMAFRSLETFH